MLPPDWKGTTIRTGLLGYVCAQASAGSKATAAANPKRNERLIDRVMTGR
jgi:hypothetical protein